MSYQCHQVPYVFGPPVSCGAPDDEWTGPINTPLYNGARSTHKFRIPSVQNSIKVAVVLLAWGTPTTSVTISLYDSTYTTLLASATLLASQITASTPSWTPFVTLTPSSAIQANTYYGIKVTSSNTDTVNYYQTFIQVSGTNWEDSGASAGYVPPSPNPYGWGASGFSILWVKDTNNNDLTIYPYGHSNDINVLQGGLAMTFTAQSTYQVNALNLFLSDKYYELAPWSASFVLTDITTSTILGEAKVSAQQVIEPFPNPVNIISGHNYSITIKETGQAAMNSAFEGLIRATVLDPVKMAPAGSTSGGYWWGTLGLYDDTKYRVFDYAEYTISTQNGHGGIGGLDRVAIRMVPNYNETITTTKLFMNDGQNTAGNYPSGNTLTVGLYLSNEATAGLHYAAPTGNPLYTATTDSGNVPINGQFSLTTSFPVTAGTPYWIVYSLPTAATSLMCCARMSDSWRYLCQGSSDGGTTWGDLGQGPTDLGFTAITSLETIGSTWDGGIQTSVTPPNLVTQPFILSESATMNSIYVKGNPSGNSAVTIYPDNGSGTGPNMSSPLGGGTWNNFWNPYSSPLIPITPGIPIIANIKYWAVFSSPDSFTVFIAKYWARPTDVNIPSGYECKVSTNSGTTWSVAYSEVATTLFAIGLEPQNTIGTVLQAHGVNNYGFVDYGDFYDLENLATIIYGSATTQTILQTLQNYYIPWGFRIWPYIDVTDSLPGDTSVAASALAQVGGSMMAPLYGWGYNTQWYVQDPNLPTYIPASIVDTEYILSNGALNTTSYQGYNGVVIDSPYLITALHQAYVALNAGLSLTNFVATSGWPMSDNPVNYGGAQGAHGGNNMNTYTRYVNSVVKGYLNDVTSQGLHTSDSTQCALWPYVGSSTSYTTSPTTGIWSRTCSARVYQTYPEGTATWYWTLPNETPTTVASVLIQMAPTYVGGLIRMDTTATPLPTSSPNVVADYNTIRTTVLASYPNCKFGITIRTDQYSTPASIAADIITVAGQINFDVLSLNSVGGVPDNVIDSAVTTAHSLGKLVVGGLCNRASTFDAIGGSIASVVPVTAKDLGATLSGSSPPYNESASNFASMKALGLPITLSSDNFAPDRTIFNTDWTQAQRETWIGTAHDLQLAYGYYLTYPIFGPTEDPINTDYDAVTDGTLAFQVATINSPPYKPSVALATDLNTYHRVSSFRTYCAIANANIEYNTWEYMNSITPAFMRTAMPWAAITETPMANAPLESIGNIGLIYSGFQNTGGATGTPWFNFANPDDDSTNPSVTVSGTSSSGQNVLHVANTYYFDVGEMIEINHGQIGAECLIISSINPGVSFACTTNLTATHYSSELIQGVSSDTSASGTNNSGQSTINVIGTYYNLVGQTVTINPGGSTAETLTIFSMVANTSITFTSNMQHTHYNKESIRGVRGTLQSGPGGPYMNSTTGAVAQYFTAVLPFYANIPIMEVDTDSNEIQARVAATSWSKFGALYGGLPYVGQFYGYQKDDVKLLVMDSAYANPSVFAPLHLVSHMWGTDSRTSLSGQTLSKYDVIYGLPDISQDATYTADIAAVKSYVANGGTLIVCRKLTDGWDSTINDLLGVSWSATNPSGTGPVVNLPGHSILKPYAAIDIVTAFMGTDGFSTTTRAITSPSTVSTIMSDAIAGPALWVNSYGKGKVVFLPCPYYGCGFVANGSGSSDGLASGLGYLTLNSIMWLGGLTPPGPYLPQFVKRTAWACALDGNGQGGFSGVIINILGSFSGKKLVWFSNSDSSSKTVAINFTSSYYGFLNSGSMTNINGGGSISTGTKGGDVVINTSIGTIDWTLGYISGVVNVTNAYGVIGLGLPGVITYAPALLYAALGNFAMSASAVEKTPLQGVMGALTLLSSGSSYLKALGVGNAVKSAMYHSPTAGQIVGFTSVENSGVILVVAIFGNNSGFTTSNYSVGDSANLSWAHQITPTASAQEFDLFYAVAPGGVINDTITVTPNGSGSSYYGFMVIEIEGANPTPIFDPATAGFSQKSYPTPNCTTLNSGDIMIVPFENVSGGTGSIPSFTNNFIPATYTTPADGWYQQIGNCCGVACAIVSSSGAQTTTVTFSDGGNSNDFAFIIGLEAIGISEPIQYGSSATALHGDAATLKAITSGASGVALSGKELNQIITSGASTLAFAISSIIFSDALTKIPTLSLSGIVGNTIIIGGTTGVSLIGFATTGAVASAAGSEHLTLSGFGANTMLDTAYAAIALAGSTKLSQRPFGSHAVQLVGIATVPFLIGVPGAYGISFIGSVGVIEGPPLRPYTPPYSVIGLISDSNPLLVWPFSRLLITKQGFTRGVPTATFTLPLNNSIVPNHNDEIKIRMKAKSYVLIPDGSTGYLSAKLYQPSFTALTTSVYFKTNTQGTILSLATVAGGGATTPQLNLYVDSDGTLGASVYNGGLVSGNTTPTYNDGKWHFAMLIWDGLTIRLAVDGVCRLIFNATIPTSPLVELRIGADEGNGNGYFSGSLSDVRLYSTNMSDGGFNVDVVETLDAANLYAGYDLTDSLVGHWSLDQSSGPTPDDSGNGQVALISGSVTWLYDTTSPYYSDVFGGYITVVQPEVLFINFTAKDYGYKLQTTYIDPTAYFGLAPDTLMREIVQNVGLGWGVVTGNPDDCLPYVQQAVEFVSASSGYVEIASSFGPIPAFTISFLYNTTSNSGTILSLTTNESLSTAPQVNIGMSSGILSANLYTTSGNTIQDSSTTNDGYWHWGALIYDGTTATLLRDGNIVSTLILTYTYTTFAKARIGRDEGQGYGYFNGYIDDLHIYSQANSVADTTPLYEGNVSNKTNQILWLNSSGLVTSNLSGLTVGNWLDKSPYSHNGVAQNYLTGVSLSIINTTQEYAIGSLAINAYGSDVVTQMLQSTFNEGFIHYHAFGKPFHLCEISSSSGITLQVGTNGFLKTWTAEDSAFYTTVKVTGGNQNIQASAQFLGSAVVNNLYSLNSGFVSLGITRLHSSVLTTLAPNVDYTADGQTGVIQFNTLSPAMANGDTFTANYVYSAPIQATGVNAAMQNQYEERDYPYSDPSITDQQSAQLVANQLINYYSTLQYQGDFQRGGFFNNIDITDSVQMIDSFRKINTTCGVVVITIDGAHGSTIYTVGTYLRNNFDFAQVVRQRLLNLTQIVNQTSVLSRSFTPSGLITLTGAAALSGSKQSGTFTYDSAYLKADLADYA